MHFTCDDTPVLKSCEMDAVIIWNTPGTSTHETSNCGSQIRKQGGGTVVPPCQCCRTNLPSQASLVWWIAHFLFSSVRSFRCIQAHLLLNSGVVCWKKCSLPIVFAWHLEELAFIPGKGSKQHRNAKSATPGRLSLKANTLWLWCLCLSNF